MTATVAATACPACADERLAGASFCEACGQSLTAAADPGPTAETPAAETPVSEDPDLACPACDTVGSIAQDGYCGHCGILAVRPRDHLELRYGGGAAVTDRGRRHHRNEDAVWLAARTDGPVELDIVVCDGVSSSFDPDVASAAAAQTAGSVLERNGDPLTRLEAAIVAAGTVVAALAAEGDPRRATSNPACTIVAACVRGAEVSYGWVGDSRAYWIAGDDPAQQLTEDDSWATHAIRQGIEPEQAWNDRRAHAITAWLGADAGTIEPRTGRFTASRPGHLLLCSDGLWNYLLDPVDFGATFREHLRRAVDEPDRMLAVARSLTEFANAAGGSDNITVAVTGVPAGRGKP